MEKAKQELDKSQAILDAHNDRFKSPEMRALIHQQAALKALLANWTQDDPADAPAPSDAPAA